MKEKENESGRGRMSDGPINFPINGKKSLRPLSVGLLPRGEERRSGNISG